MDLSLLQASLRQFAAERDWQQFHTPKNLAMALMVEAAELAEIFQWMTPEQSRAAHGDKVVQERIGDEVADVLLYLLQLADHSLIDLKRAVGRKLVKNAKKHPPTRLGLPAGPMGLLDAQTHVLVDWENVQPKDAEISALVPDATDVWIFHGRNQRKVDAHQKAFGDRLTLVPISRSGKNALDFHLSFYMGYISARNPDARFVVISNDQGYGPMLDHAKDLGFAARQVGFVAAKTVARKAAATKPPAKTAASKKAPAAKPPQTQAEKPAAKKPAARKTAEQKATPAKPRSTKRSSTQTAPPGEAPRSASAQAEQAAQDKAYAHVVASIKKAKDKPARRTRLRGMVRSLLEGGQADAAAADAVIERLVADGHVSIDGRGAVVVKS